MTIEVLAIGDVANNAEMLQKYLKKTKINIIHFPYKYKKIFISNENAEFFSSFNIFESVKKVRSLKDRYGLFFVTSWAGARIAYLAGVDYIIYFVGTDIQVPPFVKNSDLPDLKIPTFNHNFMERFFYKKVLDNALACVTSSEPYFTSLHKFRKDAIRIDRVLVDSSLFGSSSEPLNMEKTKFTFFSPQRFTYFKGLDLICKALPLCKTDFDIIQVEWFDDPSEEGNKIMKELIKKLPSQIKFVPVIKRTEISRYYNFADAILGQMRGGVLGSVEREGVFCRKPVIFYNPEYKYEIDKKRIIAPFLPTSNEVENIAKTIDQIVSSEKFRQELVQKQFDFIRELCDPEKTSREWDALFDKMYLLHKKTPQKSPLTIFLRKILFISGYILHKRIFLKAIVKAKQKL